MCHYITATLPAGADSEAAARIADRFSRAWEPVTNASLVAQLRPGEQYFCTTRAHCDCGTALGSAKSIERNASTLRRKAERMKHKGWGPRKIERWLDEKQKGWARRQSKQEARLDESLGEVRSWESLLRDMLSEPSLDYVGLLLHWYSGGLDEKIALSGKESVGLAALTPEFLARLEEDVLYRFRGSGR